MSISIDEYGVLGLFFYFEDVPIAKLTEIAPKLWQVLRSIDEKTLDMGRMRTILRKKVLGTWAALEAKPHRCLARSVNTYMIYGTKPEEVRRRKTSLNTLRQSHL